MRIAGRTAAMALWLASSLLPHLALRGLKRPSPFPAFFLRRAGGAAGLRVQTTGRALQRDVLFVANHVSWLDIFALGGATGAVFVSKDDIARWPIAGWIAGLHDTLYVEREERRRARDQADTLRAALASSRSVALFPEGTVGDGATMLPFRPSLFASLFPPLPRLRVQPVAIDYGDAARAVAWAGDGGPGADAKRLLSRPGRLEVTLHFLAPIDPAAAGDRKALAALAQRAIGEVLFPLAGKHAAA